MDFFAKVVLTPLPPLNKAGLFHFTYVIAFSTLTKVFCN